jgi:hypothetical protein
MCSTAWRSFRCTVTSSRTNTSSNTLRRLWRSATCWVSKARRRCSNCWTCRFVTPSLVLSQVVMILTTKCPPIARIGLSEFVAIDEESNHEIVHVLRLGEAQRAADEALDPGPHIDMFAVTAQAHQEVHHSLVQNG